MNLVCPGCQTSYPLPPHIQQNHPFTCPKCRHSGTVGAIMAAAQTVVAPPPAAGGFQMPGPPQGVAPPAPAAGGFQMPGPPTGDGFQMPGPPGGGGFALPGPPTAAAPPPLEVAVEVTAVEVTPVHDAGGLDLAPPAPSAGLDLAPAAPQPPTSGGLDLAEPESPPAPPPSSGLDLAEDEPADEPEEDHEDGEGADGGYEEGDWEDEPAEASGPIPENLKKLLPVIAGVALLLVVGLVFAFSGDDPPPRKKRKRGKEVASKTETPEGQEKGADPKEGDPKKGDPPSEPAPPPKLTPEQEEWQAAASKAKALEEKGDAVGAFLVYVELSPQVQKVDSRGYRSARKRLLKLANKALPARIAALEGEGKHEEGIALIEAFLDKGKPSSRLRAKLKGLKRRLEAGKAASPEEPPTPTEEEEGEAEEAEEAEEEEEEPPSKEAPAPPAEAPASGEEPPATAAVEPEPKPASRPAARVWKPEPPPSKDVLLDGMPEGATVTETKHYIILSTADEEFTKDSSRLLESVFRGYFKFFKKKGFETKAPEFPLVAYVFGTRAQYEQYLKTKRLGMTLRAAGFYFTGTNALYFSDVRNSPQVLRVKQSIEKFEATLVDLKKQRSEAERAGNRRQAEAISRSYTENRKRLKKFKRENAKDLESSNEELTIHEATHQLCYNSGLLTVSDVNPEWLVEGLAMLFEDPGVWKGRRIAGANASRIDSLLRGVARDQRLTVRDLVGSNQSLISRADPSMAYASAWALIHMFMRGKFKKYKKPFLVYLKAVQERAQEVGWSVRGDAAATERLAQFEEAFGEVSGLEDEYRAYVDKLIKSAD